MKVFIKANKVCEVFSDRGASFCFSCCGEEGSIVGKRGLTLDKRMKDLVQGYSTRSDVCPVEVSCEFSNTKHITLSHSDGILP